MHAKTKFLIMVVVLLVLLVAGLLVIYYFYSQKQSGTSVNTNTAPNNKTVSNSNKTVANTNQSAAVNTNETAAPNLSEQDERQYVLKRAKDFAERFGTYSNQNQSNNLINLMPYMTDAMKQWADNLIAANKKKAADIYVSQVARSTTLDLTEFESGQNKARVIVGAVIKETKGLPAKESEYQAKLDIEFLKVNGVWLVNSAYWHKN